MIWGNPAKSREEKIKRECYLIAQSNTVLLGWHAIFTWRKVELLDGRFARFCWLHRKFVLYNDKRPHGDIYNGNLDILDCPRDFDKTEKRSLGTFVYRAVGQSDEFLCRPTITHSSYVEFEAKREERAHDLNAAATALVSPPNGRRKAIRKQQAKSAIKVTL